MGNGMLSEVQGPAKTPDLNKSQDLQKVVDLMAKLTPAECEQHRKTVAKQFSIRASSLDAMVKDRRKELESETAGNSILAPDAQPWDAPVDGAELLDSIRETFKKHVILPENGDVALALWSVGTYCFDEFRIWPRLLINSPEKRCGKTSLLEILGAIVKRALSASNCTPASMFRVIDQVQPTLLLDEGDTFLNSSEELRGIVNCGHSKATGFVVRCTGDEHNVQRFSAWSPLAIAMIGQPPGTIVDRSICVSLRRKGTASPC
jgi:putative DNA primase/helicase